MGEFEELEKANAEVKIQKEKTHRFYVMVGFVALAALIVGILWAWPKYKVWKRGLEGQAILALAESERKVLIEEAKAKEAAAALLAKAEVARAHGVAQANAVIAEGLGGPEGYLRWLWVQGLEQTSNQVIYVATEANLPILEANRIKR